MGDRSPKEKMKKQKQHKNEHEKHQHEREENMHKNRRETPVVADKNEAVKKAG